MLKRFVVAVAVCAWTPTELEGTHLENNMFTMFGSAAKGLAGAVKRWVKVNGAMLTAP